MVSEHLVGELGDPLSPSCLAESEGIGSQSVNEAAEEEDGSDFT